MAGAWPGRTCRDGAIPSALIDGIALKRFCRSLEGSSTGSGSASALANLASMSVISLVTASRFSIAFTCSGLVSSRSSGDGTAAWASGEAVREAGPAAPCSTPSLAGSCDHLLRLHVTHSLARIEASLARSAKLWLEVVLLSMLGLSAPSVLITRSARPSSTLSVAVRKVVSRIMRPTLFRVVLVIFGGVAADDFVLHVEQPVAYLPEIPCVAAE